MRFDISVKETLAGSKLQLDLSTDSGRISHEIKALPIKPSIFRGGSDWIPLRLEGRVEPVFVNSKEIQEMLPADHPRIDIKGMTEEQLKEMLKVVTVLKNHHHLTSTETKELERELTETRLENSPLFADRKFMSSLVEVNGLFLEKASPELKNDKELVFSAVRQNGLSIQHASSALQADISIALEAIRENPKAISFIPSSIRSNQVFIVAALSIDGKFASSLPIEKVTDPDLKEDLSRLVLANETIIKNISPKSTSQPVVLELLQNALVSNPALLNHIPKDNGKSKSFQKMLLKAMESNPEGFLSQISSDPESFKWLLQNQLFDRAFGEYLIRSLQDNPALLHAIEPELANPSAFKDIVLTAMSASSKTWQNEDQIKALEFNPSCIRFIKSTALSDPALKKLLIETLDKNHEIITMLPPSLLADKEVQDELIVIISENPTMLRSMTLPMTSHLSFKEFFIRLIAEKPASINEVPFMQLGNRAAKENIFEAYLGTPTYLDQINPKAAQDPTFQKFLVAAIKERPDLLDSIFQLNATHRPFKGFATELFLSRPELLQLVTESHAKEANFFQAVKKALESTSYRGFDRLPPFLQANEEIVLNTIVYHPTIFSGLPESWRTNPEFLIKAARRNGTILKDLSHAIQMAHPEVVLEAVKNHPEVAVYAPGALLSSRLDIPQIAVKGYKELLTMLPLELLTNPEFISSCLVDNPQLLTDFFDFSSESVFQNHPRDEQSRIIILQNTVAKDPSLIEFIPDEFKSYSVVATAVRSHPTYCIFAGAFTDVLAKDGAYSIEGETYLLNEVPKIMTVSKDEAKETKERTLQENLGYLLLQQGKDVIRELVQKDPNHSADQHNLNGMINQLHQYFGAKPVEDARAIEHSQVELETLFLHEYTPKAISENLARILEVDAELKKQFEEYLFTKVIGEPPITPATLEKIRETERSFNRAVDVVERSTRRYEEFERILNRDPSAKESLLQKLMTSPKTGREFKAELKSSLSKIGGKDSIDDETVEKLIENRVEIRSVYMARDTIAKVLKVESSEVFAIPLAKLNQSFQLRKKELPKEFVFEEFNRTHTENGHYNAAACAVVLDNMGVLTKLP
jgi:hypothetical protein